MQAAPKSRGAPVFGCQVNDPQRYGIIELGSDGRPLSIAESQLSVEVVGR
jgi:dTDP-glucose pyrophosphorylase